MKLPVYEDRKHNQWLKIGSKGKNTWVMRLREGDILADVTTKEIKKDWLYIGKAEGGDEW